MAAQLKVVGTAGESGNMDRAKALEAALAQIDRAWQGLGDEAWQP